jgi:FHS family L-fucose permease-like MFS transporter
MPWNRHLYGLFATAFFMQICGGVIECIGNVWTIQLWGKYCGPFNLAVQMSWGLGAFISPLIAAPFLSETSNMNQTRNSNDTNNIDIGSESVDELQIKWAYGIGAAFCLFCVFLVFIMYFIERSNKPHPSKIEGDKVRTKLSKWQKVKILTLLSLLFHFYCSISVAVGRLLESFSVFSDLKLSKAMGAYITSIYWGTFTFARIFAIFIIALIGSKWMLWISFTFAIISNAILLAFGQVYQLGLIIGAALLGLGVSSIFPTLFSLAEEFIPVTTRIGALFLVSALSGELIFPIISGYFIETFPMLFIYMISLSSVVSFILYAFLFYVIRDN